mgnify:CR=1 FL=1
MVSICVFTLVASWGVGKVFGLSSWYQLTPTFTCCSSITIIGKDVVVLEQCKTFFVGRIVVANQVLLASIWYIASAWIFSRASMNQIQRLIRNFLWSGKENSSPKARVAWHVITLPVDKGGLGLIDPWAQAKALLGKYIVRALLPDEAQWKCLLLRQMLGFKPPRGGSWSPSIRWFFLEHSLVQSDMSKTRNFQGV